MTTSCTSNEITEWDRNQSDWLTGTVTANVTLDAQPVSISFDDVTFIDAEWTGSAGMTRSWQAYITPENVPPTVIACEVIVRIRDTSGPEPVDLYLHAGTITFVGPSGELSGGSPTPPSGDPVETVSRGTLYLKASGTGIDVSNSLENWGGDGTQVPYVLDTDRSSIIPAWASAAEGGGFNINERGMYLQTTAAKGTARFTAPPDSVGIDLFDSNVPIQGDNGINLGFYSDGSDNSPPFTPLQVTPLVLLSKSSSGNFIPDNTQRFDLPLHLVGIIGDQQSTGDLTGATLDIDVRVAITQLTATAPPYTEADFS